MTESPDKQPDNEVVGVIKFILALALIGFCIKLYFS